MSKKYPALERIGIGDEKAKLIRRYSIRQQGNTDVVKIYFKRKPHDLLPHNSKFVFNRTSKRVLVDGGRQIYEDVFEVSPFIDALVKDLTRLEAENSHFSVGKQKVIEDLEHLRRVVDQKIEEIENELSRLDNK